MATPPLTAVRLRIKALGYDDIIPLHFNKVPFDGWRTQPSRVADIRRWGGVATGVRLNNQASLFALDIDVRTAHVRDAIVKAYERRWPAFMAQCLRRHSQATTLMLIGRCSTAKGMRRSGRWHRDSNDIKGNLVEAFTNNCKRQIAVQGAHSAGRVYGYYGRAIWDTPLADLPWFPDADIADALAIADRIMAVYGLHQRTPPSSSGAGEKVWDLEPTMEITLSDGEVVALAALERRVGRGERITAFATLWDPTSTTSNRVLANLSATGLSLWDSKTGLSHRWRGRGPAASVLELLATVRATTAGGAS
jgi:hypothetical protein